MDFSEQSPALQDLPAPLTGHYFLPEIGFPSYFWSSSNYEADNEESWIIDLRTGELLDEFDVDPITNDIAVWAVRGGTMPIVDILANTLNFGTVDLGATSGILQTTVKNVGFDSFKIMALTNTARQS